MAAANVVTTDDALSQKLAEWYAAVLQKKSGIMLETDAVQVGVKQEFRGDQARIQFFVGNKSPVSCSSGHSNQCSRPLCK